MSKTKFLLSLIAIPLLAFSLAANTIAKESPEIIHDTEQQRLEDQHGEKWVAEDKGIDAKLEQLRKKFGKRPNIIHIMWDDMKYGAIGHPMLNQVTGYKSPLSINWRPRA